MDKLNSILQVYIDQNKYPGIQWQIIQNNKKYQGKVGYKNINTKEVIEDNTIYRIWSMTKPIVSIVAMQLFEKKIIKLEDPIKKYLPKFFNIKVLKNLKSEIDDFEDLEKDPTIKDLLLHTAGFSYNFLNDPIGIAYDEKKLFYSSTSTLEEEIENLTSIPLLFQPSSQWCYSVSIDVLGRILEVIMQSSLQEILKNQIFIPLGMNDTGFYIEKEKASYLMSSYEFDSLKKKLIEHVLEPQRIANCGYPLHNDKFARGGHGLFSTIKDFMLFTDMLHTGKSKNGRNILQKDTIDFMTKNHLKEKLFPIEILSITTIKDENYINDLEGYGWGLGFRTLMHPNKNSKLGSKGEFGWSGAASTYFLVDPVKKISAVLMTQVLNGDISLKKDFYNFIYNNF